MGTKKFKFTLNMKNNMRFRKMLCRHANDSNAGIMFLDNMGTDEATVKGVTELIKAKKYAEALFLAFYWTKSREGFEFWNTIYEGLLLSEENDEKKTKTTRISKIL